jgi:GAF domain-containing protein
MNNRTASPSPLGWLTSAHQSIKDISNQRRAEFTALATLAILALNLLGGIASYTRNGISITLVNFGAGLIISVVSYLLARTPFFKLGGFFLALSFIINPFLAVQSNSIDRFNTLVIEYHVLGLIVASALTNSWATWLLTGISVAGIFSMPLFGQPLPSNVGGQTGIITTIGLLLIIVNNFRERVEKARLNELEALNRELSSIQQSLELRIEERTEEINRRSVQLEASAVVARTAAEFRNLDDVINNVVDQITDRFGYYHAGVFLTDSTKQHVILQAASSTGGKQMVERGHRLEIGRQGIVGYAAYQKRPRIAQDVGADAVYFNNPYLPETHSEIALPLVVQNRLIGVLDIQSKDMNAFSQEDVYTLQTMADQVALAIENARLLAESQGALDELQRLTSKNTLSAWRTKFAQEEIGYTYSTLGITKNTSSIETESTTDHKIKIPIRLRGQQVGTIVLKRKESEELWSTKERELAEKISDQVALAVDNARLLEESQRRAAREQNINEITGRFGRSLDLDTLLQNAVRELHRIPQVTEVSVQIKPTEEEG